MGRVVIPKEIRRTLRIREGDPLEIFTDREGEIILKKYSPIGELTEFAGEYVESLFETTRHIAIITDRDGVIAVSGSSKKDYTEKRLSPELEKIIESRETYITNGNAKPIRITANEFNPDNYTSQIISPILVHGDPIGRASSYLDKWKVKIVFLYGSFRKRKLPFLFLWKNFICSKIIILHIYN
ncbi:MAG: spoVT [Sedimentibacter sp.]|nr:spoVT [Sedimentibacter sp.]